MTLELPGVGDGRWELARHARIIVYEAEAGDRLVTAYDCGAVAE